MKPNCKLKISNAVRSRNEENEMSVMRNIFLPFVFKMKIFIGACKNIKIFAKTM